MNVEPFQWPLSPARSGNDSGNWPIPLVTRTVHRPSPELDGEWFEPGGNEAAEATRGASLPEFEAPFTVVSRRRLRAAHALFAAIFVAALALAVCAARIYLSKQALL